MFSKRVSKLKVFLCSFVLMLSFSFSSFAAQALNNGLVDFVGSSSDPRDYIIGVLQSINYHLTADHSGSSAVVVHSVSSSGSVSLTCYTNMLSLTVPVAVFDSQNQNYYLQNTTVNGTFITCLSSVISQIPRNLNFYMNKILSDLVSPLTSAGYLDPSFLDLSVITYVNGAETFSVSTYNGSMDFVSYSALQISNISSLLRYYASRFYEWFYPLDNVDPEYWRYYNTDTKQSENIGLAGLMYNISWYLGQLYVLQSANAALEDMADAVQDVSSTFQNIETQEHAIVDSVSSSLSSFNPSSSDFTAFVALGWVSQFMQSCFTSLGLFGNVILLSLILAVCMQFIGYFRYRE